MATSIGSSTASNSAQIAALENQLSNYQKQLQQLETPGAGKTQQAIAQVVSTQITLVEDEIAQLSNVSQVADGTSSTLGTQIDVHA